MGQLNVSMSDHEQDDMHTNANQRKRAGTVSQVTIPTVN